MSVRPVPRWHRCLPVLALALLGACSVTPAPRDTHITILHTNDHHGRFWRNAAQAHGLAARKTLVDRIRAEVRAQGGHTLLLDAGDVNTGVPESDLQDAEPDFRGMSLLGYDAMAVGNHEFDNPLPVIERQRRSWSAFPWLSANVYAGGRRMFEPYRLFRLGPVRVAVLGLTTDDTARMLDAKAFPGLAFEPPVQEAAALVPALRREADVVVALTHMGHYPGGARGVNAPGDVALARAVPDIDVIVGGHSQTVVCMLEQNLRNEAYEPGDRCAPDRQNGAWIVQAGEWGKFVGRADFVHRQGRFELLRYTLIPVNLGRPGAAGQGAGPPPIPEDPQALALLAPFQARGSAGLGAPVGRSEGRFDGDRAQVRSRQTSLGALITAALRDKTGADVAVVNAGAIRDSLSPGALSHRDILQVLPFGNRVVVVTLRGHELAAYLQSISRATPGAGAYPQLAGVCGLHDAGGIERLRVGGRPVDPDGSYRMAINSFAARGGDGYPDLRSHPGYVDTGFVDAQVLGAYISARGVIAPTAVEACSAAQPVPVAAP